MRTKLLSKGFDADEIEATIDRLREKRYIRDDDYATARAKSMLRKNYSLGTVERRLKHEGLPLTDEIKTRIQDEQPLAEEQQVLDILEKNRRKLQRVTELKKVRQKMAQYLMARGFNPSHFRNLLSKFEREILGDSDSGSDSF
jgi:SOS response regulatory protein OraA/RecX